MDRELYSQAAVIAFREDAEGQLEVLLIRRPDQRKWRIPKGIVEPGISLEDTARDEAVEEAGIVGRLSVQPVGYYSFKKWGGICHVSVFLMRVTDVHAEYPEKDNRMRRWFPPATAAQIARRKKVRKLIAELPRLIKQQGL